jgi:hypothetical protein
MFSYISKSQQDFNKIYDKEGDFTLIGGYHKVYSFLEEDCKTHKSIPLYYEKLTDIYRENKGKSNLLHLLSQVKVPDYFTIDQRNDLNEIKAMFDGKLIVNDCNKLILIIDSIKNVLYLTNITKDHMHHLKCINEAILLIESSHFSNEDLIEVVDQIGIIVFPEIHGQSTSLWPVNGKWTCDNTRICSISINDDFNRDLLNAHLMDQLNSSIIKLDEKRFNKFSSLIKPKNIWNVKADKCLCGKYFINELSIGHVGQLLAKNGCDKCFSGFKSLL